MNKLILSLLLGCAVLQAQPGINTRAVRDIRLENLKHDYSGTIIRFVDSNSRSCQGVLLDVTEKNIIVSELGSPVSYEHSGINYVFVDPGFKDLIVVFGLCVLGGASGYLGVIVGRSNPDASMKGVASSLGLALGGSIGFKTFYKPIKIDISGVARK